MGHGPADGQVDVAFLPGRPTVVHCHSETLWDEQLFAVLPESDPLSARRELSLADLKARRFIFMRADPALSLLSERLLAAFGAGIASRIETQAIWREATLMQLVALGRGVTLKTAWSADRCDGVVYRPIASSSICMSAVWLRANPNPARLLSIARAMRLRGEEPSVVSRPL